MPNLFNFEIHTPQRLFYSGRVQSISLALADGEIGILANHAPFTAVTATGVLRIKDDKDEQRAAFVSGGIIEVKEHKNVLMVDCAEWPNEIDKERALESKKQADENLLDANFRFESDKAREKLRRAEGRLKVLELANIAIKND